MSEKHHWLITIRDAPAVSRLAETVERGDHVAAEGAWGSACSLLTGALAERTKRPVLLVVAHLDDADEAVDDLGLFADLEAASFSALEVMPGESNVSVDLLADRLEMVGRLAAADQPDVLVAPIQALMQSVPEPGALGELARTIEPGRELDPQQLAEWLDGAGYNRTDGIEEPGDFAVRGGIVDVYPPGNLPPARLDFFGDQVEQIAEIDLQTMASGRNLDRLQLIGAAPERIASDERTTNLWSLLRDETFIVMQETMEIAEQGRGYFERLTDPRGIYAPDAVTRALAARPVVEVNQFASPALAEQSVRLPVEALHHFDTDAAKAVKELAGLATGDNDREQRHRTVVLCRRSAERDRLRQMLAEHAPAATDRIEIELGYLFRGFVWECGENEAPLALVPHHEMLHRYQARRRVRKVSAGGSTEAFFDIEPGDYVVHAHHGIAIFRGMRMMKHHDAAGEGEEYLTLEFAGKAKLHVPASQIELVHKYVGGFSGRPPLSKLGGTKWQKQKEQAAEAARDLAKELLRVQAARQSQPGIRYGADSPMLKQFEAEFPYQETDDQLAAAHEIKKDMADPRPMDRLLCGDVGYGKTELAIRAAFKAVEGGKQVAILCPTTVLCEQHERTFRERMADYPIHIASLNRFKQAAEKREVLKGIEDGSVDIAIGTHRLLSTDVRFADLGLVVIDEEQRFGVRDKSKLMRYRLTTDVLTMSATPIPRTLHMSMMGLRDISSLSTPPADRRAVVTEVAPFDEQRIRHAIDRELNRGGQCFFVHNRVHNIHQVATEVQTLAPEARVEVAHGQMRGRELEAAMLRFLRGEADVLVCTTIIESGIDIPTANTMFITECDRYGLAELHQLRGRVGRYKHRAYCYLLLPRSRTLSDVASQRLRAIEQFSMLGAGFRIAMRDMEIRGVGNILGPQQSGHIATVGYELYCQLLERATRDLKQQGDAEPAEAHLELQISGHLPRDYIPNDTHRMTAYRRVERAASPAALRQVERELIDAYGELPKAAQTLVALAEIRAALRSHGVEALKRDGPDLIFTTRRPQTLSPLLERAPGSVRLVDEPGEKEAGTIYYRPPEEYLQDPATLLAVLRKLLVEPIETEQAAAEEASLSPG